jgi:hypothetical protein
MFAALSAWRKSERMVFEPLNLEDGHDVKINTPPDDTFWGER